MEKLPEALECYEISLDIRRRIEDRKGEGWMLYSLAKVKALLGDNERSQQALAQALRIAGDVVDQELADACEMLLSSGKGENDA